MEWLFMKGLFTVSDSILHLLPLMYSGPHLIQPKNTWKNLVYLSGGRIKRII